MVKVAVAGGTGGIGRHIVEGILATKKHDVIVLSRSQNPELEALGAKVVTVSYTDPSSLENALKGVHTVISTIHSIDTDVWVSSQLAVLDAAKKVGAVRFAPSEFARRGKENDPVEYYAYKAKVSEAARKSGLEYTIFENGIFMNYLASGTKGIGHLQPLKFVVDIENGAATIPGDGNVPFVITRGEDVGAFVAASLDLPKWPEYSRLSGDRKSWNEIVSLAEEVTGKKFKITYLSAEDLQKNIVPNPPNAITNFYTQVFLEFATSEDANDLNWEKGILNELCPSVKPVGVEEFMKTWWGGN